MTRLSREAAAALPAPRSESDAAVAAVAVLRAELQAARFTNARVSELLGPEAVAALDREQIAPGQLVVSRLLQQERPDPCAVFTALWLLDMEVDADVVSAALPRLGAEGLQTLGLAHRDGGTCRPSVDLRPYQVQGREGESDLWVTSDLSAHQVDGPLPAEHVLGVGQASLTLASITHRRPVRRALDIGTGCGIQLFHLLDHAEHVVATDLSDRALAFTRFNLLLNAPALRLDPRRLADRVELRRGSLLDPVAGETFDLVVSNPPFVITPRVTEARVGERYTYRDGGRTGDELMAELIGGLPAVLAPGGTAQMLGNWEVHGASDWQERPRGWAQEAGLDAWFVQRDLQDGPGYAETWLRDAAEERDLDDYRRRYAEYVEDFATRGVTAVGFGLIWLHRPRAGAGPSWVRLEEITHPVDQPLGPILGRAAERALAAAADPAAVLDQRLVVAGDVTEERHQRFGAADPEVILARQGGGLRRARPVSSGAAGVLGAADGDFEAGQLITAVGALLDDGTVDVEQLTSALREEVLELYVDGFLTEA
ncbi:DUF7059 domain-containing protein [Nesterenkonia sp. K-15-9-6]|uniref:DUF7059 domain-containing protein n=1 Tax=Nesterenkonia sp. K-15-9-6 TaxID=3093918 RepID=UPI004044F131